MQKRRMGKCIRLFLLAASLFGATGCKEESGKDSLPKEPDAAGTVSAEYGVTPVLEKKEELPAEKEVTVSYANWTDSAELFCVKVKGVPAVSSWEKYLSANFAVTA